MKTFHQSTFDKWPFEDKSIQAIITSPPYYTARVYNIPETIIGGNKDCEHIFDIEDSFIKIGSENVYPSVAKVGATKSGVQTIRKFKSTFCSKCNAFKGQYGLEPDFRLYIDHTRMWAKEAWRVLKDEGVFFLNLGDCWSGSDSVGRSDAHRLGSLPPAIEMKFKQVLPRKCKILLPHRIAMMLCDDGWILRNDLVWHRSNAMPEAMLDRFAKRYEYIFMFVKSQKTRCWKHIKTGKWVWEKPEPDYIWRNNKTEEITTKEPENWRTETFEPTITAKIPFESLEIIGYTKVKQYKAKLWTRINLWKGFSYFLDLDPVREEHAPATKERVKYSTGYNIKYLRQDIGQPKGTFKHILEKGKNPGDVWIINTRSSSEEHWAMWPPRLVEKMILCSTRPGDKVLDPFCGSGITLRVAEKLNRTGYGIDLGYVDVQKRVLSNIQKRLF